MDALFAKRRPIAALLAAAFLATATGPVLAQGRAEVPPPPAPPQGQEYEPKFIWGLLLNIAFKFAMSAFSEWLANKITNDLTNPSAMQKILLNAAHATIVPLADAAPFGSKSAGAPANAVPGEPAKPVSVENGRENFQGVHVAIVGFGRNGAATGIRPVTAGFRSGDRIKLKVLPTFDGLLVIDNINPKGEKQQIYPPRASDVVRLKAGEEVLIPLARDEYFEFAGVTGDEQLVITLRDPRAFAGKESTVAPNRKDEGNGSSFVQETPGGTYPVIAQALRLQHGN